MGDPRSFLRTWLAWLVALALLVVAFNYVVDPYDVFGVPRIPGISLMKPGPKNHALLAKTYQIARARPVTVLIGASNVHIGIDSGAPQWPAAMRPVYNYGIPGFYNLPVTVDTLREALSLGTVKYAVVALDFEDFMLPELPPRHLTTDERRYHTLPNGAPNPYRPLQVARDMFLSLATMGSLLDSLHTVIGQSNPGLLNLKPDGSSTPSDFVDAARQDGMHDLFAQKDDFDLRNTRAARAAVLAWRGPTPNMNLVTTIIDMAKAHHVRLTFMLVPHHADALEIYWRLGLWPRIERMKQDLAALIAREDRQATLWDFVEYRRFTTEPVPAAGDRHTQTRWFWEPTHFKHRLGDVMIQRMFGHGAPHFGAILTPSTVDARNQAIRARRMDLVCGHKVTLLTALPVHLPDGCPAVSTAASH